MTATVKQRLVGEEPMWGVQTAEGWASMMSRDSAHLVALLLNAGFQAPWIKPSEYEWPEVIDAATS